MGPTGLHALLHLGKAGWPASQPALLTGRMRHSLLHQQRRSQQQQDTAPHSAHVSRVAAVFVQGGASQNSVQAVPNKLPACSTTSQ